MNIQSPPSEKKCCKCKKDKPLSDFFKSRCERDGYQKQCKTCQRENQRVCRAKRKASGRLNYSQEEHRRRKYEVMSHYSGGDPACACCGESTLEFLSIDHINGGGSEHRKELRQPGKRITMYRWLKRHGYPPGYRVLCHNCNQSLGTWGYCPHQKSQNAT